MAAIILDHLRMKFGDFTALSDIELSVQEGEFLTLLGPSGCGKTTLLKLISGFLIPTSGTIIMDGKDVTKVPPEARDTALCFQSYALFPHLTVRGNLEFGLQQKKVPAPERRQRIEDVAEKLGLNAQMDKLPNQLSGGQQQRVSLGRALVMRPKVILFDEPLSNLDAKLRDQVRIEIRRIQREYGLTAIYVTHDQTEALAMSDRVVVLNGGTVEQIDTPEALYYAPRTRFVADFIGDANVFDATVGMQTAPDRWQVNTSIGAFELLAPELVGGENIEICWRPEHAQLCTAGDQGIAATVLNRAFQGHYTDLLLKAGDGVFRVQALESAVQEGDEVRVNVPSERVRLLEPVS